MTDRPCRDEDFERRITELEQRLQAEQIFHDDLQAQIQEDVDQHWLEMYEREKREDRMVLYAGLVMLGLVMLLWYLF